MGGRPIATSPIPHGRDMRTEASAYYHQPPPRLLSPLSASVSPYTYPPPPVSDAPYRPPSMPMSQWRQGEAGPSSPTPRASHSAERATSSGSSRQYYPPIAPEYTRSAAERYEEASRRTYPREAYEGQGYIGEPEASPSQMRPYGYHHARHYPEMALAHTRIESEIPFSDAPLRHQYSMPQLGGPGPSRGAWPIRDASTSSRQSSATGEYSASYPSASSSTPHGSAEAEEREEDEEYVQQPQKRRRSTELEGPRPRTTRKTLIACDFCRGRKLRCDGNRPACWNCISRGNQQCVYQAQPRRRGPGKAPKGEKAKKRATPSAGASTPGGPEAGPSSQGLDEEEAPYTPPAPGTAPSRGRRRRRKEPSPPVAEEG